MKKIFNIAALLLLFLAFTGCQKEENVLGCTDPEAVNYNSAANVSDNTCNYEGTVTYWSANAFNYVNVTVNGVTKTISAYYPNNNAVCDDYGCATFKLSPGIYNMSAEEEGLFGQTWTGTVVITANFCKMVELQP